MAAFVATGHEPFTVSSVVESRTTSPRLTNGIKRETSPLALNGCPSKPSPPAPSVATDGTLTHVRSSLPSRLPVSLHGHVSSSSWHGSHLKKEVGKEAKTWGDPRLVLLLLGFRLGLGGVNPIYYETIKLLYTFPQSVGIAYYFLGVRGDGLFHLDPHHSPLAMLLRPFVREQQASSIVWSPPSLSPEAASAHARRRSKRPESGKGIASRAGDR
ncbi:hypothetical protein B0H10DRAFT_2433430 [Mycena sp. CBHHK59/15]|nr:hypothetical protein B0H10DRAFT_2433430 [Mycena sp. CBHHK59/15]